MDSLNFKFYLDSNSHRWLAPSGVLSLEISASPRESLDLVFDLICVPLQNKCPQGFPTSNLTEVIYLIFLPLGEQPPATRRRVEGEVSSPLPLMSPHDTSHDNHHDRTGLLNTSEVCEHRGL